MVYRFTSTAETFGANKNAAVFRFQFPWPKIVNGNTLALVYKE